MKNLLQIVAWILLCQLAIGQTAIDPHVVNYNLQPVDQATLANLAQERNELMSTRGGGRAIQNLVLDYVTADSIIQSQNGGVENAFAWNVNTNFPQDSFNNLNLNWAFTAFDTLFDLTTFTGYEYPATPVTLDSFTLAIRHVNTSGQPDTLIVNVYEYDRSGGILVDVNENIAEAILFSDTFITNTSLTPNFAFLIERPNLTLPAGQTFGVGVDFRGPTSDTFQLIATYSDQCAAACAGGQGAFPSYMGVNSLYRLILELAPPTGSLSGVNPVNFTCTGAGAPCNQLAIQNFLMTAFVTADVQAGGPVAPVADFSGTPTTVTLGNAVAFTDLSTNTPTSWSWSFGDGNTSTLQNPTHTYAANGLYTVTLTATNAAGNDTETKVDYILVQAGGSTCNTRDTLTNLFAPPCDTIIGSSRINGSPGYLMGHNGFLDQGKAEKFTNTTTGTVNWVDLAFAAAVAGSPTNTVNVTVWDADGAGGSPGTVLTNEPVLINSITTGVFSRINFTTPANVTGDFFVGVQLTYGTGDSIALFHTDNRANNASCPLVSSAWELSDLGAGFVWGEVSAIWNLNTAIAAFAEVCSPGGPAALVADFSGTPLTLPAGNSVTFTDATSGGTGPYTYAWTFGDGGTSTVANPVYQYNTPGTYDVSLTVTDAAVQTDTETKVGYVVVTNGGGPQLVCDTTSNLLTTDSLRLFIPTGGWGYISGMNNFLDEAKAEKFSNSTAGVEIQGTLILFGAADGNPNSTVTVGVWDATGAGGSPGTRLTSETVTFGTIQADITAGDFTTVNFTTPATVNGDYFIGVEFTYIPGDTVGILTTQARTPNTAWELFSGGGWFEYNDGSSWGLDVAHWIAPFECVPFTCPNITGTITPTDAICTNNGEATVAGAGGTAPYSYSWSGGAGTGATVTGLAPGSYTVTITDTDGCTGTATTTIAISNPTISATTSSTQTTCNAADGTATAAGAGGAAPYSYAWDANAGNQTTATATGLAAGSYGVVVTDGNGCTVAETVTVTAGSGGLAVSTSSTDASCGASDGTATATPVGGTAAYTYAWTGGQTTATATGLAAGTYDVTVTDANGCVATASATVVDAGSPSVSATTTTDVTCFGGSDGFIEVSATGGTPGYTYAWGGGQTTAAISGLTAGTYNVTVTDASGCNGTLAVTITEPATALVITASTTGVSCPGGSDGTATAIASGGTSPYQYTLDGGASQATGNFTGLAAGTYTIEVTDANGCTDNVSATVAAAVNPVTVSVAPTQTGSCGGADGTLTANVSGGATPYTFAWSNGQTANPAINLVAGTYDVTVTDANGCTATATATVSDPASHNVTTASTAVSCNGAGDGTATLTVSGGATPYVYTWSPNVSSGATATNLDGGTYNVTVRDAGNCNVVTSVVVAEPDTISANVTTTDVSCFGAADGTAFAIAAGGNGGFSYQWLTSPVQNGQAATGLSGGDVTLVVTDGSGCQNTFTVNIAQPAAIVLNVTSTDVSCNGGADGSATATATGGTPPFQYAWSGGQSGPTASGLAAGSYTVTATDASGCTASSSVTISEPTALTVSVTGTDASCNGATDGTATATASGGTSPYTYAWNGGQTGGSLTGLAAGTYIVTATDANGCTATGSVTVNEPSAIVITLAGTTPASCAGGADGTATVTVTGGDGNYTYSWSNSDNTATATGLSSGTSYSVTVTDGNGCNSVLNSVTVADGVGITVSFSNVQDESCGGSADGAATAVGAGGSSPYTYAWGTSPTQTGATATGLAAGNVTVTVTDANGCTVAGNVTIGSASAISVTPAVTNASCNGGTDGQVALTVSGGTPGYTYLWSDAQTTATATGLSAGAFGVTVTDANGCTQSISGTVGEATTIALTASATDESASGANDGTATASATGGTPPYTYSWSNSATGGSLSNLAAGPITVTVTDANGCTASETVTVGVGIGIGDVESLISMNLYPNPTTGNITLNLELANSETVVVQWYNMLGEQLIERSFSNTSAMNETFDLSNNANGVYFARIIVGDGSITERVVLTR